MENWLKPMTARGLWGVTKKLLRRKHLLRMFNRMEIGDIEQSFHQAKGVYEEALTKVQEFPLMSLLRWQKRKLLSVIKFTMQDIGAS